MTELIYEVPFANDEYPALTSLTKSQQQSHLTFMMCMARLNIILPYEIKNAIFKYAYGKKLPIDNLTPLLTVINNYIRDGTPIFIAETDKFLSYYLKELAKQRSFKDALVDPKHYMQFSISDVRIDATPGIKSMRIRRDYNNEIFIGIIAPRGPVKFAIRHTQIGDKVNCGSNVISLNVKDVREYEKTNYFNNSKFEFFSKKDLDAVKITNINIHYPLVCPLVFKGYTGPSAKIVVIDIFDKIDTLQFVYANTSPSLERIFKLQSSGDKYYQAVWDKYNALVEKNTL